MESKEGCCRIGLGLRMPVRIQVPGSKSLSHRALILGALSNQTTTLTNVLWAADTEATARALRALGANLKRLDNGDIHVEPVEELSPSQTVLECGNSGTTLRLMMGQVARLNSPIRLDGDTSLRHRPNGHLIHALRQAGVHVDSTDGRAPVTVVGPLTNTHLTVDCTMSSQFGSSLLMALPMLTAESVLIIPKPIASRPYLTLTHSMLTAFGVELVMTETATEVRYDIPGNQRPSRGHLAIEGDWSTAAFPAIAAILSRREGILTGLDAHSEQGDRMLVDLLRRFGHRANWAEGNLSIQWRSDRPAGLVDLATCPDLFPAMAVLAANASGRTELRGAPQLRHKESDRIALMVAGLRTLGVPVVEYDDGMAIDGKPWRGGHLDTGGDHRILMAFETMNLSAEEPISVTDRGVEQVSYPTFYRDLARFKDRRIADEERSE
jgi:3-phosphoshikimate 1-carboxyvinyltransferase